MLDLVHGLHEEVESARVILRRGAYRLQRRVARIEAQTLHYRDLQVAYVSGLLQVRDYMLRMSGPGLAEADRDKFIAARLARQRVLHDQGKRFTFVMTEGALRWRQGRTDDGCTDRTHRCRIEIAERPPWRGALDCRGATWGVPRARDHIYDERLVIVGIETATANIQDPRDIAIYLRLFGAVESVAVFGDDARGVLSRIAADYRVL